MFNTRSLQHCKDASGAVPSLVPLVWTEQFWTGNAKGSSRPSLLHIDLCVLTLIPRALYHKNFLYGVNFTFCTLQAFTCSVENTS